MPSKHVVNYTLVNITLYKSVPLFQLPLGVHIVVLKYNVFHSFECTEKVM